MAEEKTKQTLFDAIKPLILSFNLVYGFNLGHRKPPGKVKIGRKKIQKLLVWCGFLFALLAYFSMRNKRLALPLEYRSFFMINLFCSSFYLFAVDEAEVERLIQRMKEYPLGKMSRKMIRQMTTLFLVTLLLLLLPTLMVIILSPPAIVFSEHNRPDQHQPAWCWCLGCLVVDLSLGFILSLLLFPAFTCCLCCVLVSYCPSRLDDHVQDIRRAHSPLRRARLLTRLCHAYYRLQPLASMTNRNMAATMSLIKVFTMFLWVISYFFFVGTTNLYLYAFGLPTWQYTIPLFTYLRVAPSANNMREKIFKTATEVLMTDDEWQVRHPISRSLLTKMRLNLLKHLVHIRMDQGPFTLLGVSVDPETFFMIFVEANDLRTVLG